MHESTPTSVELSLQSTPAETTPISAMLDKPQAQGHDEAAFRRGTAAAYHHAWLTNGRCADQRLTGHQIGISREALPWKVRGGSWYRNDLLDGGSCGKCRFPENVCDRVQTPQTKIIIYTHIIIIVNKFHGKGGQERERWSSHRHGGKNRECRIGLSHHRALLRPGTNLIRG
jgi:hypothetical protein